MIRYDRPCTYLKSSRGDNISYSHLWSEANSTQELHMFAGRIGLEAKWFQDRTDFPHYDISGKEIVRAKKAGAVFSSSQEWVDRHQYRKDLIPAWENPEDNDSV